MQCYFETCTLSETAHPPLLCSEKKVQNLYSLSAKQTLSHASIQDRNTLYIGSPPNTLALASSPEMLGVPNVRYLGH